MKIRTIHVSYPHPNPIDATMKDFLFRVERATDSVDHVPGEYLTKKQVGELCASPAWKVTTVPVPA